MSCATLIQRLHVVSPGGVPEPRAKISGGFVDSDMPGNTRLDNSLDLTSSEVSYCVVSTLSRGEIICGGCDNLLQFPRYLPSRFPSKLRRDTNYTSPEAETDYQVPLKPEWLQRVDVKRDGGLEHTNSGMKWAVGKILPKWAWWLLASWEVEEAFFKFRSSGIWQHHRTLYAK